MSRLIGFSGYKSNQHSLSTKDFEGMGNYESFGADWGGPNPVQLSTIGPLMAVPKAAQPHAVTILNKLAYQPDPVTPYDQGAIYGTVSVFSGMSVGGPWASDYLAQGYAILIGANEINDITNPLAIFGKARSVVTKDPAFIAGASKTGSGTYAIVAGPEALIAQAVAIASGAAPAKPEPIVEPPAQPEPSPGGGQQAPQQAIQQASATPEWVLPTILGLGAAGLLVAILATRKKKA